MVEIKTLERICPSVLDFRECLNKLLYDSSCKDNFVHILEFSIAFIDLRPITHYGSFFRVFTFLHYFYCLPWLQNDAKMWKPENPIFSSNKNDLKTQTHAYCVAGLKSRFKNYISSHFRGKFTYKHCNNIWRIVLVH